MGVNWCKGCNGTGKVPDPRARWWQLSRFCWCGYCGGDGYAKPPGWPDQTMMRALRPASPPPPPPKKI